MIAAAAKEHGAKIAVNAAVKKILYEKTAAKKGQRKLGPHFLSLLSSHSECCCDIANRVKGVQLVDGTVIEGASAMCF